jgi:hypothetical protein
MNSQPDDHEAPADTTEHPVSEHAHAHGQTPRYQHTEVPDTLPKRRTEQQPETPNPPQVPVDEESTAEDTAATAAGTMERDRTPESGASG